jgi:3-oxoacyl-[acyl-carrier-protein] synthase-1
LEKAGYLLRTTSLSHCIVGAVDSLVEFPALAWLEEAGRVKTDDRSDGFIPGEAAGFLVLELGSEAARRGALPMAEIKAPVTTREEATIFGDMPLRGHGLAEAILGTLARSWVVPNWIICDLNGEYYRSKEWALAMAEIFADRGTVPELWHPAENIGDVGAASAIVFSVVAMAGLRHGYFQGDNVLVWTSSDSGGRGAVIVAKPAKWKQE